MGFSNSVTGEELLANQLEADGVGRDDIKACTNYSTRLKN